MVCCVVLRCVEPLANNLVSSVALSGVGGEGDVLHIRSNEQLQQ